MKSDPLGKPRNNKSHLTWEYKWRENMIYCIHGTHPTNENCYRCVWKVKEWEQWRSRSQRKYDSYWTKRGEKGIKEEEKILKRRERSREKGFDKV